MQLVLGWLGSLAALGLWIAPIYDMFWSKTSVWRMKSSSKLSTGFHLFASCFNCLLWVAYLLKQPVMLREPLGINLLGLGVNLLTSVCYWKYARGLQRKEANIQVMGLIFGLLVLSMFSNVFNEGDLGAVAVVFNVLMYFGPLLAARRVCELKNNDGMPLPPLLMTLLCGTLWLSYGLLVRDLPMIISNCFGCIFGVLQVIVWVWGNNPHSNTTITQV